MTINIIVELWNALVAQPSGLLTAAKWAQSSLRLIFNTAFCWIYHYPHVTFDTYVKNWPCIYWSNFVPPTENVQHGKHRTVTPNDLGIFLYSTKLLFPFMSFWLIVHHINTHKYVEKDLERRHTVCEVDPTGRPVSTSILSGDVFPC